MKTTTKETVVYFWPSHEGPRVSGTKCVVSHVLRWLENQKDKSPKTEENDDLISVERFTLSAF